MTRHHGDAIVVTEGLRKRFGTKEALTGLDLSVPTGTIFGLLGPNGAGKSTAVKVLSTLTRPTSGRATVAGYDVATEAGEVRKRIGLAGQHPAVDDKLTGRENLRMFGRLARLGEHGARARADELLAKFDLEHAADRLTETYSGGMRRRIDLITSLITTPAVLFLDEPTTGLDPRSRNEIWATVRDLVADGTTVLLTTQYLDEADQLAANIAVVDGGKVIASGTPDELKARIGSHLDVIVSDPAYLAGAATVLSQLGNSVAATDLDELSVSVALRAEVQLPVVVRELDAAGVVVRDVGLRKPTLDDVFLTLTGKEVAA
jgi:ABC-2 type transport system ATP-binding protein